MAIYLNRCKQLVLSLVVVFHASSCTEPTESDVSDEENTPDKTTVTLTDHELKVMIFKEKIGIFADQLDYDKQVEFLCTPQVLPDFQMTESASKNLKESAKEIGVTHFEEIHFLIGYAIWDYLRTKKGYEPLYLVEKLAPDPTTIEVSSVPDTAPPIDKPFSIDNESHLSNSDVPPPLGIVDRVVFEQLKKKIQSLWENADQQKITQIRARLLREESVERRELFDAINIREQDRDEMYKMLEKLEVRNDIESIYLPSFNPSPFIIYSEIERKINPEKSNSLELDIVYWADITRYEEHIKIIHPKWREYLGDESESNNGGPFDSE